MRVHFPDNFTGFAQVPNQLLEDERISWRAKGVHGYLLSRPENWETDADRIAAAGKEGREAVRTAMRELETYGWIARPRRQDPETGHWSTDLNVYRVPQAKDVQVPLDGADGL